MFDLSKMVRPREANQKVGKPDLFLPTLAIIHSRYKEELASKELADCAAVIKSTHLLYRWKKYTGLVVLCTWDRVIKLFTHFSNDSFREFLGAHFDLQEKNGTHFGLPAAAVADRIWQTLLSSELDLPWASWELTAEYTRNGK